MYTYFERYEFSNFEGFIELNFNEFILFKI